MHYLDGAVNTASPRTALLDLYKDFNNQQGNSPDNSAEGGAVRAYTNIPDNEDLNNDNTLSDIDQYYQYRMRLRPGQLEVGSNYITDKLVTTEDQSGDGNEVTWYQFRIPIQDR